MRRLDQRQGFLVSAAIHLTLLMILISQPPSVRPPESIDPATLERRSLVFLPPPSVLRQMAPAPPRSGPPATLPRQMAQPLLAPPPELPADPVKKDRVSVGGPGRQADGPVLLKREDDLTRMAARGEPSAAPTPALEPPRRPTPTGNAASEAPKEVPGLRERPGREGLIVPPRLLGRGASGDEGQRGRPGSALDRAAQSAVDDMARRLRREAELGVRTGTGQNVGGLRFDPQGADFTLWLNRFKNEVYRNWIVPQAVLLGFRGHVDFDFTVERDGSVSSVRMLKSSGTASLDRAAQNALTSSRFMQLPEDYGPPRVTMQVTFSYNEGPLGS